MFVTDKQKSEALRVKVAKIHRVPKDRIRVVDYKVGVPDGPFGLTYTVRYVFGNDTRIRTMQVEV